MDSTSNTLYIPQLILAIVLPVALGTSVGLVIGKRAKDDYQKVKRPKWSPPSWAFGPVWTTLYTLMGIASWFVWKEMKSIQDQISRLAMFALTWCTEQKIPVEKCRIDSDAFSNAWRASVINSNSTKTFADYSQDLTRRLTICKIALTGYAIQLLINIAWSPVYFKGHRRAALAIIALLDILVVITLILFAIVRPIAAWLLVPYVLWLGLASALNTWIIKNNR